jgi:hypothetical protein
MLVQACCPYCIQRQLIIFTSDGLHAPNLKARYRLGPLLLAANSSNSVCMRWLVAAGVSPVWGECDLSTCA